MSWVTLRTWQGGTAPRAGGTETSIATTVTTAMFSALSSVAVVTTLYMKSSHTYSM